MIAPSFVPLRPGAELCGVMIRRQWQEAWFSGLNCLVPDFLVGALSVAMAMLVGRYTLRSSDRYPVALSTTPVALSTTIDTFQ
jgi:hypothetical protein